MFASHRGYTATVQVLVKAGADKEAKDNVRESENMRENRINSHSHSHVVDKFVWGGVSMASHHVVVAECTCAP